MKKQKFIAFCSNCGREVSLSSPPDTEDEYFCEECENEEVDWPDEDEEEEDDEEDEEEYW